MHSMFMCWTIYYVLYQKLLEIEKEIVREVARGGKHYLRKYANRKAQIRQTFLLLNPPIFVLCDLQIFAGRSSTGVYHLEKSHAQSLFLFPIVFGINLIPIFFSPWHTHTHTHTHTHVCMTACTHITCTLNVGVRGCAHCTS